MRRRLGAGVAQHPKDGYLFCMVSDAEDLAAALRPRYELERVVGVGGMATVYLARELRHGRRVALKVLRPDLAAVIGAERFLKEIEIAAALSHPNILPLLDSGQAGRGIDGSADRSLTLSTPRSAGPSIPRSSDFLYYVMPFVEGGSLRQLLRRESPLPAARAAGVVREVADALAYAHRQGIIHRDIKPENILFLQGHAVVTDFGIAKAVLSAGDAQLTRSGFPLGTPGYMSPEQAAGSTAVDARMDVYGLACVAYEMVVGQTPGMWLDDEAVRLGRFTEAEPAHRERLDRLPGRVEQVLAKALAMHPNRRYRGPDLFAADFAAATRPGTVVDHAAARRIVRRAATLEPEMSAETGGLTMGGVERIAAEAGIPPSRVREVADGVAVNNEGPARGGVFGLRPTLVLERVVDAEVARADYGGLLEEIRVGLGETGQLNATLDDSMLWSSPVRGGGRKAEVLVSPRPGGTRVRIADREGAPTAFALVPIGVGSAVLVGIVGAIVSGATGSDAAATVAGIGASLGAFTTGYLAVRFAFRRQLRRRHRELQGLLHRLETLIRDRAYRREEGPDVGTPPVVG
jgi:hypothetical protein